MSNLLLGLALMAVTVVVLKLAIPRRQAGLSATGLKWLDQMLPLTLVSTGTIGLAMVSRALIG